jgi:hypothetical protein
MNLLYELGTKNIKEAIQAHPPIGEILDRYGIGCTKCTVGTCLLKDVVSVHFLGAATETQIEEEINGSLRALAHPPLPFQPEPEPGTQPSRTQA